nr:hypothetical protein Iba_scaffold1681204CG0010 [Ipomoea batatas]
MQPGYKRQNWRRGWGWGLYRKDKNCQLVLMVLWNCPEEEEGDPQDKQVENLGSEKSSKGKEDEEILL